MIIKPVQRLNHCQLMEFINIQQIHLFVKLTNKKGIHVNMATESKCEIQRIKKQINIENIKTINDIGIKNKKTTKQKKFNDDNIIIKANKVMSIRKNENKNIIFKQNNNKQQLIINSKEISNIN